MKKIKLLCRHEWEHTREVDWHGDILIERVTKKCHKCGKVLRGDWVKIGGSGRWDD